MARTLGANRGIALNAQHAGVVATESTHCNWIHVRERLSSHVTVRALCRDGLSGVTAFGSLRGEPASPSVLCKMSFI